MKVHTLFYPCGATPATAFAAGRLEKCGISIIHHPSPEITHLLLDIPSFSGDGRLRNGSDPVKILESLPEDVTIVGGGLAQFQAYPRMDLLENPFYIAQNARITAHCALQVALSHLPCCLYDLPVLVIGWGRIGKCLGKLLQAIGADTTILARKETDRALIHALGMNAIPPEALPMEIRKHRLIFNTVPVPLLSAEQWTAGKNALKIELASVPGILSDDVIEARGLPGRYAPETSGTLIADTIVHLLKEEHP